MGIVSTTAVHHPGKVATRCRLQAKEEWRGHGRRAAHMLRTLLAAGYRPAVFKYATTDWFHGLDTEAAMRGFVEDPPVWEQYCPFMASLEHMEARGMKATRQGSRSWMAVPSDAVCFVVVCVENNY